MSNPKTCNDPKVIARLLRNIATGFCSETQASIFNAAADLLDPPAATVEPIPFSAKENLREVVAEVRAEIDALERCSAGNEVLELAAWIEADGLSHFNLQFGIGTEKRAAQIAMIVAALRHMAAEPQSVANTLVNEIAAYDATIAAAEADAALSPTGRQRIVECCLDAKGAINKFALALSRPE